MTKPLMTAKKSVELGQPVPGSRIRRKDVPAPRRELAAGEGKELRWSSSEREIWLALIGIAAFAIAIDVIALGLGAYWK